MAVEASAREFIRVNKDEILQRWFEDASRVASARGLASPEFTNIMPKYLAALGEADADLGTFSGARRKYIESHLAARIRQGFSVEEIVAELGLVRNAAERVLSKQPRQETPSSTELQSLWTELDRAAAAVTDLFAKHMAEDEQIEKHYLLRLRSLATRALRDEVPLRDRLDDVAALIAEAMRADSATLLLYDAAARELSSVASVGLVAKEDYVASLDIRSFVGQIAASEEPVAIHDVTTTRLEIPDALRRSGIRSLLGMRLPERETLTGVVYVGICEHRPFNGREAARLEVLGEQLTLHLDNAALVERLEANIATLEDERGLRERFVSVLAHDLRGPLSTARMAAELLLHVPNVATEPPETSHRELLTRIDRNLERTDRMVRDLLDANRIHAGEALHVSLAECDLVQIARDTIGELGAIHGARFLLSGDPAVRGRWDCDELRRALWNLGVNAAKYGTPAGPITVSVRAAKDHAELSVHNEGSPIAGDDQEALFLPFMRSQTAKAGRTRGWGLGLTLVRGVAQAHGGSVRVQSDAASGTSFTLDLPYDVTAA